MKKRIENVSRIILMDEKWRTGHRKNWAKSVKGMSRLGMKIAVIDQFHEIKGPFTYRRPSSNQR